MLFPPLRCSSNPLVYEIQARDWLARFGCSAGICHLDELPESEFNRLAELGFDWLWLLGVWQTGPIGSSISRTEANWRHSYIEALPDLTENDIIGSPFAVTSYTVHSDFGGDAALARFRARLRTRGIRLLLDFVPNQTAVDHPWAVEHPDYYVAGTEADLAREPSKYTHVFDSGSSQILAHGRDPYFPSWPDTLQLNYGNPELQCAMLEQLRAIAAQCDGLRCDIAMLLLPEVFRETWGISAEAFWPKAIRAAHEVDRDFLFVAEAYWGREWDLQAQGFDYTYDKTLYDKLLSRNPGAVRAHLAADTRFQRKLVRFLENHDEPRVAATLPPEIHRAAAVATFFIPGMRLFHDGQLDGYLRKPSIHLARRSKEPGNSDLREFYSCLLRNLKKDLTLGDWALLETRQAWSSNPTSNDFLCFGWLQEICPALVIAINYSEHQSQCYLHLPLYWLESEIVVLRDLMGTAMYERNGDDLLERGLYLDMPSWSYHVFRVDLKSSY